MPPLLEVLPATRVPDINEPTCLSSQQFNFMAIQVNQICCYLLGINFASVLFKLLFASLICELLFKYRKWFGVCWENTRSNILCFYRVFVKLARSWLRCDKCPLLFVQFLHISISKSSRIHQTIPARISLFCRPNALNAGKGVKRVPKTSEARQVIFLER